MTSRKPSDIQLIKRVIDELKERNMDPKEVTLQLAANKTLEERNEELQMANDSLRRTRESIQQRINELMQQEQEASKRRDDRLAECKNLETERAKKQHELDQLEEKLNTKGNWEETMAKMEQERIRLEQELEVDRYSVAAARWLRSILQQQTDPDIYKNMKEYFIKFLNDERKEPYNEKIGETLVQVLTQRLQIEGALVPKLKYDTLRAMLSVYHDRYQKSIHAIQVFMNSPKEMKLEHRRAFLIACLETGVYSKRKFDEILKEARNSRIRCPHHNTELVWALNQKMWICTSPDCTFTI